LPSLYFAPKIDHQTGLIQKIKEVKTQLPAPGEQEHATMHLGNFVSRMMLSRQMTSEGRRAAFVVVGAVTRSARRLGRRDDRQRRPAAGCRGRAQAALDDDGAGSGRRRLVVGGGGDRLRRSCCRAQNSISSRADRPSPGACLG